MNEPVPEPVPGNRITNRLLAQVAPFLQMHLDPTKPVILGLSGGADSLALFYLLLAYQRKGRLDLRVVHVDHRWREESADEAAVLKKLVEAAGISFHLEVLEGGRPLRNAEDAARQARLACFRRLCKQEGCQAVLLGHHADDLAETTLKRIFEGASLTHGAAMQPVGRVEGVVLWRPLLKISKRDLLLWLGQKGFVPFEDSTNNDPHFLRTRMRQEILPMLSQTFGKEVAPSLCAIADECQQISDFLRRRLAPWVERIQRCDEGHRLDIGVEEHLDVVEAKFLIRHLCEKEEFVLSRQALDTACELLLERKANRQVAMGDNILFIDRGHLLVIGSDLSTP